jgi:hypothetical protein
MKTTLELPDALMIEAKATAARRRTTLKAIMEHALRRELGELMDRKIGGDLATQLNEYGFPILKRKTPNAGKSRLTSEMVYAMQDNEDLE